VSAEVPVVRSIVAVGAGFFATAVLSLGGDLLLRFARPEAFDAEGRPQGNGVLLVVLLYVALFGTLGGYITARLAQRRFMAHALVLGLISLALTLVGTALAWSAAPAWYHVCAVLLVVPAALLGAKIHQLRVTQPPQT